MIVEKIKLVIYAGKCSPRRCRWLCRHRAGAGRRWWKYWVHQASSSDPDGTAGSCIPRLVRSYPTLCRGTNDTGTHSPLCTPSCRILHCWPTSTFFRLGFFWGTVKDRVLPRVPCPRRSRCQRGGRFVPAGRQYPALGNRVRPYILHRLSIKKKTKTNEHRAEPTKAIFHHSQI